jgi:hypothetical protein
MVSLLGLTTLIIRPPLRSLGKVLVTDGLLSSILQAVDVIVTDTITELFLLTPQDAVGQVLFAIRSTVECFSDDVLSGSCEHSVSLWFLKDNHTTGTHLLHVWSAIGIGLPLLVHLVSSINSHGNLQKLLVQERYSSLHTECHGGYRWDHELAPKIDLALPIRILTLVGSQTITDVQVLDPLDTFLVEDLGGRSGMEIEVSSENLIGSFTGEDHLDSTSLDLSTQKVHGQGSSDGGHVKGLQCVDTLYIKRNHDQHPNLSNVFASDKDSPRAEHPRPRK